MKVKILKGTNFEYLEEAINKFIANIKVLDIKLNETESEWVVLIVYKPLQ
jgi:hypothetical protein